MYESDDSYGFEDDGPPEDQESAFGDEGFYAPELPHWPLSWQGLLPADRWMWFHQLWGDACRMRDRYRLPLRSGWWEDQVQVETLAALVAWSDRYDSGEWDDPPGKLALLYDLERISVMLRDGGEPFHPERDRIAFECYLMTVGCEPAEPG